jgi:hypothetical protein
LEIITDQSRNPPKNIENQRIFILFNRKFLGFLMNFWLNYEKKAATIPAISAQHSVQILRRCV